MSSYSDIIIVDISGLLVNWKKIFISAIRADLLETLLEIKTLTVPLACPACLSRGIRGRVHSNGFQTDLAQFGPGESSESSEGHHEAFHKGMLFGNRRLIDRYFNAGR